MAVVVGRELKVQLQPVNAIAVSPLQSFAQKRCCVCVCMCTRLLLALSTKWLLKAGNENVSHGLLYL